MVSVFPAAEAVDEPSADDEEQRIGGEEGRHQQAVLAVVDAEANLQCRLENGDGLAVDHSQHGIERARA